MSVATAMRTLLLTDSTLSTAVGTRVYPVIIPPEATTPLIVYREISGLADPASADNTGATIDMTTRLQFDIWSETYLETKSLKDALIKLVNRYSGVVGSVTVMDVIVDLVFDSYDTDVNLYRQAIDVRVRHQGT